MATTIVLVLASGGQPTAAPAPKLPGTIRTVQVPPDVASRSRSLDVRPLGHLRVPDLLATAPRALSNAQLVALRHIRGVTALAALSRGRVRVGGRLFDVAGVDPSSVRPFTPQESAVSDPLWASIARGDVAASYGVPVPLGQTIDLGPTSVRVGALAMFGLPGSDLVVNRALSAQLGLRLDTVVIAAPGRDVDRLKLAVQRVLGRHMTATVLRPAALVHRRPTTYLELYKLSASYCPGLSWTVLAAIGQIESDHGRNVGPSSAGALGPMQFMPSTWAYAGVDGDGDGKADIMNPYDAVPAAALYLCRDGAGRGGSALYGAIYAYNHADWYVREVLALAARYGQG